MRPDSCPVNFVTRGSQRRISGPRGDVVTPVIPGIVAPCQVVVSRRHASPLLPSGKHGDVRHVQRTLQSQAKVTGCIILYREASTYTYPQPCPFPREVSQAEVGKRACETGLAWR